MAHGPWVLSSQRHGPPANNTLCHVSHLHVMRHTPLQLPHIILAHPPTGLHRHHHSRSKEPSRCAATGAATPYDWLGLTIGLALHDAFVTPPPHALGLSTATPCTVVQLPPLCCHPSAATPLLPPSHGPQLPPTRRALHRLRLPLRARHDKLRGAKHLHLPLPAQQQDVRARVVRHQLDRCTVQLRCCAAQRLGRHLVGAADGAC
jgi:hypothetical protein